MEDRGDRVIVAGSLDDLTEQAARAVSRSLADRAKGRDRVTLVLSGGTTPRRLYERLAGHEVPWRQVHLFWGDERCVPPEDSRSNYRMAYDSLISRVPIPPENVHRIPTEHADPHQAAARYEAALQGFFRLPPGAWPCFDVVVLGVGSDGHTASLFPGSSLLEEKKRWVVAGYIEQLQAPRVTLTLPVFNHAAQAMFLVAGKDKAAVMSALRPADGQDVRFPFQLIRPHHGQRIFSLDQDAAGSLKPS